MDKKILFISIGLFVLSFLLIILFTNLYPLIYNCLKI
jgi:hypothetical protein